MSDLQQLIHAARKASLRRAGLNVHGGQPHG